MDAVRRVLLLPEVRRLVEAARLERALLPADSAERDFYLGVEAAAEELLQQERTSTQDTAWLDRKSPAFRDGYVRTRDELAVAATAREAPTRLRLPEPTVAR